MLSTEAPPTAEASGREANGRFAPGNRFSPGNLFNKRVASLRAALYAAVTPADMAEVVQALLEKAKAGDVPAIRELLDRVLGKPAASLSLTGPDGEALPGMNVQVLIGAVLTALADNPEARLKVADRLKELSLGSGDAAADGA